MGVPFIFTRRKPMLWVSKEKFQQSTYEEQYQRLLKIAEKLQEKQAMAQYILSYLRLDISHSQAVLMLLYDSLYQFFHDAKQKFTKEMEQKQQIIINHISHMQKLDEQTHIEAEEELLEQLDSLDD